MEKIILRGFFALGLGLLPILFRKPSKNLLITFFLTGFLANLLDEFMVKTRRVKYPVRLFKRFSDKSILFDFLMLPIACTLFIKATSKSKCSSIIGKAFLFSVPMTAFEWLLERKTRLIRWIRWSVVHNLISLTLYFLGARGFIGGINTYSGMDLLNKEDDD
ncbi:hypothetical protein F3157_19605 [Virgibacillus dakarensis]|uniref:Uncharacterized protein n=1 Tax=Lentibacillus populi TaxID=1827502 RepID=A0A9W5TYX8_9BACI|nr:MULTISPECIES: CBO0543 family protein [Bacillaceae]MTW87826.1 hypothetical protein [Virgibacillus dakarensis]GGB49129.1 hypothetical protein GCM10011409_28410 [Lentibacillus populi]